MAKISKGMILSQTSKIPSRSDYSFVLIEAKNDNEGLVKAASDAGLKVNALVKYSKDSQWDPKELTDLGFQAGCFLIVDLRGQMVKAADLLPSLALVRQYGYQAGAIDELSTLDDIKVLKANQIYLINSGKANDDQDASLNGDEITDGSGKLAVGMSVKWQRDYTNVDVSSDHAGFVGMGQDTLLKGGNAFGYSTNGRDFNAVITPKGLIFRRPDAERMWRLLKPKEIADINSTVGDKVKKEVDSATAEIPAAVSAANSAVSAAESAIAASKVNSDAIVAQSEAISEAKSAMDSATAEIQQTAANAASDAAKIRADVAQVQSEVDTAKAANSASVEALKSDIGSAKKDLADVHDSLDKAQSAIEQNQKLINDSVAKITSDVSATKQDLATVHDSLTKAQAAAEQNQKAINDSIAEINANVDATNQDLAGVRKDLTKAQSDITANQKAIDDNVAQISDDITQGRKDIADVRQGLAKAQSDIIANQKAVNDNVAQINSDIEQDRKDIASAQQANADTVKQLDAYSKQAQEQGKTIKAVQDKQDGFSATLADVQGNVSQVSDKVSGLSASLKDAQDNVASVKAQADQLSATLTNHGKSIATLTASAKELSSTLEDADGRLSKVEQTAQTNSSALSDVQGDLSQVKQNATKLVSTLKDAQGNISTLQQKADSVSTQLATAQGDIATLQTGVDSVKATLTSHDKSIHTLQADSKSLKDSMADAQGDISTLSKTATDVTSELEDHTGRLSKVEQSAAKQATTLSDLQGNLSQVEQKADSNTATISSINKNAMQDRGVITDTNTSFDSLTHLGTYSIKAIGLPKMPEQHYGTLAVSGSAGSGWLSQQFVAGTTGNVYTRVFSNNAWSAWKQGGSQDAINQVKQTADSNSATIRNVQGDVSTLKQTATGIKSTLASHEGDIHTLQADSKSLKDSMADAQGDISTLQKSATSLDSEMKDHTGRLSKVEQTASKQATTLSDLQGNLSQVKQQADGLVTTLKDAQGDITQIRQKADGTLAQLKSAQGDIASLQTNITGIKATLVSHEGDIHTLQADSRMLKDDMKDAQGNISSLQKSSTKLDSEMSSQDGRLSKVEQTAKEHTSTISDLSKKVDSNGGGVNLLTGTADFSGDNWGRDGRLSLSDNLQKDSSGNKFFITNYAWTQYMAKKHLEPGTYTFSWNAKGDAEGPMQVFVQRQKDNSAIVNIETENYGTIWKRYSYTFTLNQTEDVKIFVTQPNVKPNFSVGSYKLERGSVATPWSPAPEDLATVTQVKQTADGIETTLKNAQGDIDQIKQTAKGTSEQLADVQGNVTNIQKDIDGLKQTTADNAGNIHTLQSDSKSLHDSMQDAQGDISTLKKTSTDVTSELKDHAGRISKTEQTANTLTNEFSDQQGHLNRVEQTANGTQQTVANQQGQINTIKTDVSGIHQTITGQGNQIATINVTLNGLNIKYAGVERSGNELKDRLDNLKVGTSNLLHHSDTFEGWHKGSTVSIAGSKYLNGAVAILAPGGSGGNALVADLDGPYDNQPISWAVYAKADNAGDKLHTKLWGGGGFTDQPLTTEWQVYKFTGQRDARDHSFYLWGCQGNKGNIYIALPFAVVGNAIGTWSPNTDDIADKITTNSTQIAQNKKEIDLKANQDTVDNLTGEVSQTKAQLKVQADQISSKVSSEDFKTLDNKVGGAIAQIDKNTTAIDQTNKEISLKADQTEVDKVKGTASQNSSRLDVMAGQIQSKVTSTDVNNIVDKKGYATTSTVQSLITQKAGTINESITNLDAKYRAKDGVNLATGTGNVNASGGYGTNGNIGGISLDTINDLRGKHITISVDVEWKGWKSGNQNRIGYELQINYDDGSVEYDGSWLTPTTTDGKQRITATYKLKDQHIKSLGEGHAYVQINCSSAKISHLKIERGTVATPWTPAPIDNATVTQVQEITASIDGLQSTVANKADKSQITQLSNMIQSKVSSSDFNDLKDKTTWKSTDSIDLNTAVSQQKIFVKGGSNLPPGDYWWYVQVESGYDNRIVQYAVSDRDNIHYSRQYDGNKWSAWSQGATESEITQLRDDINLRVKSGDLLSQINLTAGNTLIQSNKLYLDASSVAFSGRAFIPSAAIAEIDADKLTFYGNGTKATIGAGIAEYDQDKFKSTINMQYSGGFEIHASNELGSILTMHDNTVRLASKSQTYSEGSGKPLDQQYSGFWASSNYALINAVDGEGKNTGWSIGPSNSNGYRAYLYDSSTSVQPNYGVGIGTQRFDVYAGGAGLYLGPDKAELRDKSYTTIHSDTETFIEGGNQQIHMHNGEVNIGNPNDTGNATGVHLRVFGWASFNGYVEGMGWTTKSTLSSKTRIEKLDTKDALNKIMSTDLETYQYKTEVAGGMTKRHAGPIIDDVHDVAQYSTPDEFINERRTGRSDADVIGYLMGAVQELKKQLDGMKKEVQING